MGVYKREYEKKGRTVWYYSFAHRKQKICRAGFTTKREAELAEQQARKVVILDRKPVRSATAISFDDLVKEFFEIRPTERAATTVEGERTKSLPLVRFFGSKRVETITAAEVARYRKLRRDAGMSPRTINLELTLLRNIFRHAMQEGYAIHNPAREVKNLPQVRTDRPIPTPEQLTRFIEEARRSKTGHELVVWLKLRALSGLRPREAFFLEWADLDFERGQIFVRPKADNGLKNRRFRVVEMHPDLRQTLVEWKAAWERRFEGKGRPHNWVFYNPFHPEKRAQTFRKAFVNARKRAGLPNFRPYDLRHYFISHAIMSGVDTLTIAQWAGHRTTRMIEEVYGHLSPEFRAAQMAKVDIGIGNGTDIPASQKGGAGA